MRALQTILPMKADGITVLLNTHCVRHLLREFRFNEDDVLTLARQEWGFDISGHQAKSRDLRLLPAVVDNYKEHFGRQKLDWDWSRVQIEILRGAVKTGPREIQYIEGTTAQLILNCSSTHLNSLFPPLKDVSGKRPASGPNSTPKITVESFLAFLRGRRVR